MSGVTVHFFPYAPVLGGLSNDVANQVVSNGWKFCDSYCSELVQQGCEEGIPTDNSATRAFAGNNQWAERR